MGYISDTATKQLSDAFGRRLQKYGVTRIQWIALYYLGEYEALSQRELSKMMMIKDSSVGRLLDRMERDGLIMRKRSQSDRRVVMVSLSKEGLTYRTRLLPMGEVFNDDLLKGITEEELKVYESVIKRMISNVSENA